MSRNKTRISGWSKEGAFFYPAYSLQLFAHCPLVASSGTSNTLTLSHFCASNGHCHFPQWYIRKYASNVYCFLTALSLLHRSTHSMHNHHQTSSAPHKRWNNHLGSLLLPLTVDYFPWQSTMPSYCRVVVDVKDGT